MAASALTILFMPESAYGPTNNCVGIGDVLRQRGHRVVFAAEASWRGRLAPLGFTEDLVDLAAPADGADEAGDAGDAGEPGDAPDAGQFWKEFIARTAPEFRKPTIEQLDTWIRPVWAELIDGAHYCHEQLTDIIARVRPDVIVEDNVVAFPALMTAGVPFVRIVSCQPLEIKDPALPPAFSGYPAGDQPGDQAGDRAGPPGPSSAPSTTGCTARCGPSSTPGSPSRARRPCLTWSSSTRAPRTCTSTPSWPTTGGPGRSGRAWLRLDSSVRETDAAFTVPDELAGSASGGAQAGGAQAGGAQAGGARSSTSRSARWARPT